MTNLQILGVIWAGFTLAVGGCIGSFLNVVIYRLPRELSLAKPGSMCPSCGKSIQWYDNIPVLAWLMLGGKCRYCKVKISPRYIIVEFITAVMFGGLFLLYFGKEFGLLDFSVRNGMADWAEGGWLIYLLHVILIAAFLAGSAIDLELWVIPLSICWLVTAAGLIVSGAGVFVIDFKVISTYDLLPFTGIKGATLAVGALAGLVISLVLLAVGIIKPSYLEESMEKVDTDNPEPTPDDPNYNHRVEMLKEIVFLLPILFCSGLMYLAVAKFQGFSDWWLGVSQIPAVAGVCGALIGYFVGCGVVWATRILGTFAFGKEAMGLGDVHLLGAAGAVIGPMMVTVAFFIAPFIGLTWALYQMFFKKTRQIPYGPFLSAAVFIVIVGHNPIKKYISEMFFLM